MNRKLVLINIIKITSHSFLFSFVILKNKADVDKILSLLNDKPDTIKFTAENEAENSLNFLDMKIKKNEDLSIIFSTYRKPTFTGTMLNWNSLTSIKKYDIRKDLLISSYTGLIQSAPILNNLKSDISMN